MEYRNVKQVTFIFLTLTILSCECLIGLRPPPHKTKQQDEKRKKEDSANQDKLALSYRRPQDGTMCYLPELFRCSSILLRQSVWNESSPCNRINSFSRCSAAALSRENRRNYMKGMAMIRKLTEKFYQRHGCPTTNQRQNQTHPRHLQSKDGHTDDCCISTLLKCSVHTFLDTATHIRPQKCQILDSYKHCLYSSSSQCQWKSFITNFPALTSFNLKCPSAI